MWKAEGYPEFLASAALRSRPGYSLQASVTRFLSADLSWMKGPNGDFTPMRYDCIGKSYLAIENGDSWHTCYYIARVLVEFLLDKKHLTFDELVDPSVGQAETLRELLAAYRAGAL
jgi:hypothetical protein